MSQRFSYKKIDIQGIDQLFVGKEALYMVFNGPVGIGHPTTLKQAESICSWANSGDDEYNEYYNKLLQQQKEDDNDE